VEGDKLRGEVNTYSPKEAVTEIDGSNGERFILLKREGGGATLRATVLVEAALLYISVWQRRNMREIERREKKARKSMHELRLTLV
jgi:hypothetical protein